MIKDNGGPAYPNIQIYEDENGDKQINQVPGMSLRDWFAGMVLAELTRELHINMVFDAEAAADRSYAVADAMLKARGE